jgi:hypothetical protein
VMQRAQPLGLLTQFAHARSCHSSPLPYLLSRFLQVSEQLGTFSSQPFRCFSRWLANEDSPGPSRPSLPRSSACDRVVGLAPLKSVSEFLAEHGLRTILGWHRGQCISNVSRFRLAAGHDHASPDPWAAAAELASRPAPGSHDSPDPTRLAAPGTSRAPAAGKSLCRGVTQPSGGGPRTPPGRG